MKDVLDQYRQDFVGLPGYDLEYFLSALRWVLEQEDANYVGRPAKRQAEINQIFQTCKVNAPVGREGSQLAVSLFCNVALGMHPVEAFIKANIDVIPLKRARGAR